MNELDNNFMETLKVLKGIADAAKHAEKNTQMQNTMKELIVDFKQTLEKEKVMPTPGIEERLEKLKNQAIELAEKNNVKWYPKEFTFTKIRNTLDMLIDKAKSKLHEQKTENKNNEKSFFNEMHIRDPKEVFINAESKGMNISNYMYMNSDKNGKKDYFKHYDTGAHKEVKVTKESLKKAPVQTMGEFKKLESRTR